MSMSSFVGYHHRHRHRRKHQIPPPPLSPHHHLRIANMGVGMNYDVIISNAGNHNIIHTTRSSLTMASYDYDSDDSMEEDDDDNDDEDDDATTTTTNMSTSTGRTTTTTTIETTQFSASPWENPKSLVGSLLERTTSRAMRTLSTTTYGDSFRVEDGDDATSTKGDDDDDNDDTDDELNSLTIENVLDATIVRTSSILDKSNNTGEKFETSNDDDDSPLPEPKGETSTTTTAVAAPPPPKQHKDKRTYLGNPSVTPIALAHSLWRSTILPYEDTVIDATCGNGKDCLALARMLFPDSIQDGDGGSSSIAVDHEASPSSPSSSSKPQLIGIDIQSRAIQNTKLSLLSSLPPDIYFDNIALLEQSHEHLTNVPRDASSVGLVCYNLGYLPGAPSMEQQRTTTLTPSNYKDCQTQTETTLNSITDASLLLRVGGLLSVMTYPGSNLEESVVVERFVEGLAMLTTRNAGGWREYAESIPDCNDDDDEGGGRVRALVTRALERVVEEGEKKQTWRVFVHKSLGRALSPVLVTAMRIK